MSGTDTARTVCPVMPNDPLLPRTVLSRLAELRSKPSRDDSMLELGRALEGSAAAFASATSEPARNISGPVGTTDDGVPGIAGALLAVVVAVFAGARDVDSETVGCP